MAAAESFIQMYLYVILGVGVGLLVFQIINILLSSGLAVDIHREKKVLKAQNKQRKDEKRQEKEMNKI